MWCKKCVVVIIISFRVSREANKTTWITTRVTELLAAGQRYRNVRSGHVKTPWGGTPNPQSPLQLCLLQRTHRLYFSPEFVYLKRFINVNIRTLNFFAEALNIGVTVHTMGFSRVGGGGTWGSRGWRAGGLLVGGQGTKFIADQLVGSAWLEAHTDGCRPTVCSPCLFVCLFVCPYFLCVYA